MRKNGELSGILMRKEIEIKLRKKMERRKEIERRR